MVSYYDNICQIATKLDMISCDINFVVNVSDQCVNSNSFLMGTENTAFLAPCKSQSVSVFENLNILLKFLYGFDEKVLPGRGAIHCLACV